MLRLIFALLSRFTRPEEDEFAEGHRPPERLGPAEVGEVFDARVSATDFAATAFDLAVRDHLQLSRVPALDSLGALAPHDWEIRHGQRGEALRGYEVVVLAALLGGDDSRRLSKLRASLPRQFPEPNATPTARSENEGALSSRHQRSLTSACTTSRSRRPSSQRWG